MGIFLSGTLSEKEFKSYVSTDVIMVALENERACLSFRNRKGWFDKDTAKEMIKALEAFVGDIHT